MTTKFKKTPLLFLFLSVSICGIAQNISNFNGRVTAGKIIERMITNHYYIDTDTALVREVVAEIIREELSEFTKLTTNQTEEIIQEIITVIPNLVEERMSKQMEELTHFIVTVLYELMPEQPATTGFNPKSLVPGWVQFERGENGKAHLFLWSQVALVTATTASWIGFFHYRELENKNIGMRDERIFRRNKNICRGLGIGVPALAIGFYVWNIIDGNTNRDNKITFMPYATLNESGVALSLRF